MVDKSFLKMELVFLSGRILKLSIKNREVVLSRIKSMDLLKRFQEKLSTQNGKKILKKIKKINKLIDELD